MTQNILINNKKYEVSVKCIYLKKYIVHLKTINGCQFLTTRMKWTDNAFLDDYSADVQLTKTADNFLYHHFSMKLPYKLCKQTKNANGKLRNPGIRSNQYFLYFL